MTADQAARMLDEESSDLNGSDSNIEIEDRTTSRDEFRLSHLQCVPTQHQHVL